MSENIKAVSCEYESIAQYEFLNAVVQSFEGDRVNIDKLMIWVMKTYNPGTSLILKSITLPVDKKGNPCNNRLLN